MIYKIKKFKERSYMEVDIPSQFFLVTDAKVDKLLSAYPELRI